MKKVTQSTLDKDAHQTGEESQAAHSVADEEQFTMQHRNAGKQIVRALTMLTAYGVIVWRVGEDSARGSLSVRAERGGPVEEFFDLGDEDYRSLVAEIRRYSDLWNEPDQS